jgi:hypothetical protein
MSGLRFDSPTAFGLLARSVDEYEVATLPARSTLYRADHKGRVLPSTAVPAFFSDWVSMQNYMSDPDTGDQLPYLDIVTRFRTTKPARLFVMNEANFRRIVATAKDPSVAPFMEKNYLRPMHLADATRDTLRSQMTLNPVPIGNDITVVSPGADAKRLPSGHIDYANRVLARIVCKLGFDGWVAFPHTLLEYGRRSLTHYTPEIVLCKWDDFAKDTPMKGQTKLGGRRQTRRRRNSRV